MCKCTKVENCVIQLYMISFQINKLTFSIIPENQYQVRKSIYNWVIELNYP